MSADSRADGSPAAELELPCCEASERNKAAILGALDELLPAGAQRVFEIGSGTGQHAAWFGQHRPQWFWQTSELASNIELIRRRLQQHQLPDLPEPVEFEIGSNRPPIQEGSWDLVFTANTLHIIAESMLPAVFEAIAVMLKGSGRFVCYGPFAEHGLHNSEGNRTFDLRLRSEGYGGVQDLDFLDELADQHGLRLTQQIAMPASNRILVFG